MFPTSFMPALSHLSLACSCSFIILTYLYIPLGCMNSLVQSNILHRQLLMNLIKPCPIHCLPACRHLQHQSTPRTDIANSNERRHSSSQSNSQGKHIIHFFPLLAVLSALVECFFNCFLLIVRIKNNVIRYQSSFTSAACYNNHQPHPSAGSWGSLVMELVAHWESSSRVSWAGGGRAEEKRK